MVQPSPPNTRRNIMAAESAELEDLTEPADPAGWAFIGGFIMAAAFFGMGMSWSTFQDFDRNASFTDWTGTQGANMSAVALGMVVIQLGTLINKK